MRFQKEDYEKKRGKKNLLILISSISLGLILVFLFMPKGVKEKETTFEERISEIALKNDNLMAKRLTVPQLIKVIKPLIVSITTFDKDGNPLAQGSGFFINSKGHIVSNLHVFAGSVKAKIKTKFGVFQVTSFLDSDENSDIILFKTTFSGKVLKKKIIKIAQSMPMIGEKIVSIGNPMGLELSASDGIVSAIRKRKPFGTVIQITSPISPGSSGSPVLNMRGEIIGIATFQMRQGQNLNFAIPISKAVKLKSKQELLLSKMNSLGSEEFQLINDPFERGEFLVRQKDFKSAVPYLKEALLKDSQNAKAHFDLGICYRELKSSKSILEFKRAIDIDSDLENIYYEMGLSYMSMNMLDDGSSSFRTALKKNPDNFKAMEKLGSIYIINKMYGKAKNILEAAEELNESSELYNLLGLTYFALSKNMKAINAYEKAIDLDKTNIESYIGISNVLIKVENWRQGIRYLNIGLLEKANSPELHFLKGVMLLGNDNIIGSEIELRILKQFKGKGIYKLRDKLQYAISIYKRYKTVKYQ